eukprot:5836955-Pyramimonas_sp.AAC.1
MSADVDATVNDPHMSTVLDKSFGHIRLATAMADAIGIGLDFTRMKYYIHMRIAHVVNYVQAAKQLDHFLT